jgi:predicted thioesterase
MIPANCLPRDHWLFVLLKLKEYLRKNKMAKQIPIRARGEARETVEFKRTLTAHHPELPPVYSTPDMIRLMETAAFHALHPYCEGDEISVGTSINIEHRAASGIGAHIQAEAVLESFDGRFYTLRVTARDDSPANRPRHRGPGGGQHWKVS